MSSLLQKRLKWNFAHFFGQLYGICDFSTFYPDAGVQVPLRMPKGVFEKMERRIKHLEFVHRILDFLFELKSFSYCCG